MLLFYLLSASLLSSTALAQMNLVELVSEIPACTEKCALSEITLAGCQLDNLTGCICTNNTVQMQLGICVENTCNITEQITSSTILQQLCEGVPQQSRGPEIIRISIILMAVTFSVVALRCISRYLVVRKFWWDDGAIILAAAILIPLSVFAILYPHYGFGKHFWDVPPLNMILLRKVYYTVQIFYVFIISLAKISILLFYLRVFPSDQFRLLTEICMAWMAVWDTDVKGRCVNPQALGFAGAGAGIFEDFVLILLPISELKTLHLDWRKKAALIFMFALGSFACIASIIRLRFMFGFGYGTTSDASWQEVDVVIWSEIEAYVAVVCACLITFRGLLVKYFPGLFKVNRAREPRDDSTLPSWRVRRSSKIVANLGYANNIVELSSVDDIKVEQKGEQTGEREKVVVVPKSKESLEIEEIMTQLSPVNPRAKAKPELLSPRMPLKRQHNLHLLRRDIAVIMHKAKSLLENAKLRYSTRKRGQDERSHQEEVTDKSNRRSASGPTSQPFEVAVRKEIPVVDSSQGEAKVEGSLVPPERDTSGRRPFMVIDSDDFESPVNIPEEDMFPYEDANPCSACMFLSVKKIIKSGFEVQPLNKTLQRRGECSHHRSWTSLVISAEAGCKLCSLFEKELRASTGKDLDFSAKDVPVILTYGKTEGFGSSPSINQNKFIVRLKGRIASCEIGVYRDRNDPAMRELNLCRLSRRPDLTVICRQISAWLPNDSPLSSLPKRVIDVLFEPTEYVKLMETEKYQQGHYICPSHRWGTTSPLTTTLATIHSRLDYIELRDLTQTFREAIQLTRRLGKRYLWIDSLCVLQDSQTDREEESGKMAMGSSFLVQPPPEPYIRLNTVNGEKMYFSCKTNVKPHRGTGNPDQSPLYERGWTLQEELLSPYFASFEPTQIYYRDKSVIHCEDGGIGPVNKWKALSIAHLGDWTRIVEDYSSRMLTKKSDRLPALSGLAHEYQRISNDTYLAGLWKEHLWRQLLWQAKRPARPGTYLGPPWSWVSTTADVKFMGTLFSTQSVEIVSTEVIAVGKDPLGQVKSGMINVRGVVEDFEIRRGLARNRYSWEDIHEADSDPERASTFVLWRDGKSEGNYFPDEEVNDKLMSVKFLYISNKDGVVLVPAERRRVNLIPARQRAHLATTERIGSPYQGD
ncbi:hypothetical protein G7Y89_g1265 [Cudoniella acicularis]|uniref:CFEM domain-containing protein n=1 Tax=Cudoniella acicularis TaxID=354080 RepID=A0A8H4RVL4_9HELO|nr:hypothetical protein G7Y89_g1265 [Cudoniella acicularis]